MNCHILISEESRALVTMTVSADWVLVIYLIGLLCRDETKNFSNGK